MSALFDFKSFCVVTLLAVCACTYVRQQIPSLVTNKHGCDLQELTACLHDCGVGVASFTCLLPYQRDSLLAYAGPQPANGHWCHPETCPCRFQGILYKFSVIGTRLSPAVAVACVVMAVVTLFYSK